MWGMKSPIFNPNDKELVLISLNPKLVETKDPEELDYLELCRFDSENQMYCVISTSDWLKKNEITWWISVNSIFQNQEKITNFIIKRLEIQIDPLPGEGGV